MKLRTSLISYPKVDTKSPKIDTTLDSFQPDPQCLFEPGKDPGNKMEKSLQTSFFFSAFAISIESCCHLHHTTDFYQQRPQNWHFRNRESPELVRNHHKYHWQNLIRTIIKQHLLLEAAVNNSSLHNQQ